MATYVCVFGRLHRLEEKEAFEAAFAQVSRTVLGSVDGILRDELINDTNDPYAYILMSVWQDKEAWAKWQRAPIHEEQVGLLQRYWKGQGVKVYHTVYTIEQADILQEESLAS